ncbi:acetyl-CoA synthetase-like protein [Phellopilus nigrolimitatus]|nr:acetyl-CoA synthetase-like protein [Phellopilus nigrolimitatus]
MSLATDGFRTPQAAKSKTFTAPPLDGSLALHQLYDFHGTHSPKHPLYVFATPQDDAKTMTWADAQRGVHRAVAFVANAMANVPGNPEAPPTVAILANSDTITYQCFLVGLLRAGIQPFPISIRNSPVGVAHMLLQTPAAHLFVSADEAMQGVAKNALAEIELAESKEKKGESERRRVQVLNMPIFNDLFPADGSNAKFELLPPTERPDLDSPALILHSSGSTAFPKLRTLTHRILLEWARTPWFGERDLHGETMAVHALPLFHASGFFHTCWAPSTGMTLSLFHPATPPVGLTPDRQLESCVATRTTLLFGIPHFMEAWSTEAESVEVLKKLKGLIFGGAPLSKSVGDLLESKGVPLWHIYGATEIGVVASCMPKLSLEHGWEYMFFSPHVNPVFVPQGDDNGTVELLLKPNTTHTPSVTNTSFSEEDVYATSDLLIRHPSVEGLYKIHGRADDQIMLSSGEKTNPGPLEHIMTRSPLIANALMFGRGRFQNGVIIEPAVPFAFDPADGTRLAKFRNEIWPYVEQATAFAPTHSRIFKEMIIVTDPAKPFEYTPKGNPRRHVSVALYSAEIDAVYAAVEAQTDSGPSVPSSWRESEAREYARTLINKVLKNPVRDEDDIFEHGCDSLQATWIRNSILHAFRQTEVPTGEVGSSFVFEYPSVASLGQAIVKIAQS